MITVKDKPTSPLYQSTPTCGCQTGRQAQICVQVHDMNNSMQHNYMPTLTERLRMQLAFSRRLAEHTLESLSGFSCSWLLYKMMSGTLQTHKHGPPSI